jgi:hypothetical protein
MICVERGDASAGRGSVRAVTAADGGAFTRANDGTAPGAPAGFDAGAARGATTVGGGCGLAFGASRGATTGSGISGIGAFPEDGSGAGGARRPMIGGACVGLV